MFAVELKNSIERHSLARRGKRVLALLEQPDSEHKRRVLARIEAHVAVYLGQAVDKIDWSKVDWAAVIEDVLKLILVLLPLIA